MINVPRCMSTQHPDNVTQPFFARGEVLEGVEEIKEAYYAFSRLGADEQMWDYEGKEVDSFVVKKLLSEHEDFFREKELGRDVFITLRVPNPALERAEAKVLLETLESIPRSYDAAKLFYQKDATPLFEVILPMTTSHKELNRVYLYYRDFVVGKKGRFLSKGDVSISEWIGDFKPDAINVIPLVEDKESLLNAHNILAEYLKDKRLEYQRIFLARSDPAENYSSTSATLLNKIALQRLKRLEEQSSIEIYPILGMGSPPFRGSLTPTNVDNALQDYPSVQTVTLQSAFKYDHPEEEVVRAVTRIKAIQRSRPIMVDEERCTKIVEKLTEEYGRQTAMLAPLINQMSPYVPKRRARKLHVGLFGYARSVRGIALPRAIEFCAALYSMGLPPESLGITALSSNDIDHLKDVYKNFEQDLRSALRYFNKKALGIIPSEVVKGVKASLGMVDFEPDVEHIKASNRVIECLRKARFNGLKEAILRAALVRRFLG